LLPSLGELGVRAAQPKDWGERMARAQERVRTEDRFGKLHHSIGEHMPPRLDELDDEVG
jgi:hypothetical protein